MLNVGNSTIGCVSINLLKGEVSYIYMEAVKEGNPEFLIAIVTKFHHYINVMDYVSQ